MLGSIAVVFVLGTPLTACWLRLVSRLTGTRRIPTIDLLIITGLCSALAPLPRAGWILALIVMSLLINRAEHLDAWPEGVLTVSGSAVVWLLLYVWVVLG